MILRKKPRVIYPCKDGTYSTHKRRGACNWHQGLKSKDGVKLGPAGKGRSSGIDLIPLKDIRVAHEWFQNRAAPYSLRSVQNIMEAVKSGSFRWANMDAITVWKNPAGGLFVLSGHSRFEAFTQLCAEGEKIGSRGFCSIPAKLFSGSLAAAKKIALESNTLSTKETDLERATFYRRQRESGADAGAMQANAKRLEGRNANTILAFSFLSPTGKTWRALEAMSNGQADSKTIINNVGRWIGNARRKVPALTNSHEDELYEWLVTRSGYGSGSGQVNSETKFAQRLASIINRRTTFGQLEERLNIQSAVQLSPVERQYNAQLEEAKKTVFDIDKELKAKVSRLAAQGATPKQVADITAPLERALRNARLAYQGLRAKSSEVQAHARNEQTLFGVGTTNNNSILIPGVMLFAGLYWIKNR
ncbi:hypothetical protein [Neolewinella agarilytica]|uniref:Uncharacterized protein n=1 Tax=Neolewinella agarilytica TaxID=478744 RepID=A0A1H9LX66_9BACT|nr:hypothetical protein [Neolewinella agarilytica]SER16024.1 hypothetical protein SAMN05444359_12620 [Neolewinella agarilytica]